MNQIMYLEVDNSIRTAKATACPHPHHTLFHVLFEDGYENMFFNDVETGRWIEEDLGTTQLANALGGAIKIFNGEDWKSRKTLQWFKAVTVDRLFNFGFYKYELQNCCVYEIYGDNLKFRYSLVKTGCKGWEVFGAYNLVLTEENTAMVKLIAEILNTIDTSA